jgi:hypothetical protein
MQLWAGIDGLTGFVLIYMLGKQVYRWDAQLNPFGYMYSDPMTIRLEYAKGTYTLYMNGTAIASEKSQLRPDTIGFGLPPIFSVPISSPSSWSSFKIDSIKILPPTSVSLMTSLYSMEVGYKVDLNGRVLDIQGTPITGTIVGLSYQAYGLSTWNTLTTTTTNAEGAYTATWVPAATGNFLLKAEWQGDAEHAGTFECKNVSVTRGTGETVFLAESNSTLSSLAFNSDSKEIRFTASGPSGTTGYVRFVVSKTLLENLTEFQVYLDGQQVEFTATSEGDSQVLYFQYSHSSHDILIKLLPSENPTPSEFSTPTTFPLLEVAVVIVFVSVSVAIGITVRRRKVVS